MEMKVLPAHPSEQKSSYIETGPNFFFKYFRACQIPQPITCSLIFISPEQFCMYYSFVNQDLTVNRSASALNSHWANYLKLFFLFGQYAV